MNSYAIAFLRVNIKFKESGPNMAHVCVVGGAGFLGSHVADALTRSGHIVTIYDQRHSAWAKPNQKMVIGDILDIDNLVVAVKDCEYVYNFSGLSDLNAALDRPLDTIRANILGNTNVLEACRLSGVRRFLYASTVYVYSRQGGFYRCSKQSAELYIEQYKESYGIDYTILRFGSLYGPRSGKNNGLRRIVEEALRAKRISYVGSPEAIREYIHVEDAARACVVALDETFINQNVILTGQQPTKVVDLMGMLAEILGMPQEVTFQRETYDGHYVRTPYSFKLSPGLKYISPMHVDLGQGLLQLVEELKSVIDSEEPYR
jgi:UDP-glucose 4-epimerase